MARKYTWVDAIEEVLRKEKGPLHVRDIAKKVAVKKYGLPYNPQTVSERCQRDARFRRIRKARNTFDLKDLWKNPEDTIQSMITIKAGTLLGDLRNKVKIDRKHCQKPGCKETRNLRLHHAYKKADLFKEIAKNHGLSYNPDDPIKNILRGFTLLLNHHKFNTKMCVRLLCRKHHNEEHNKN